MVLKLADFLGDFKVHRGCRNRPCFRRMLLFRIVRGGEGQRRFCHFLLPPFVSPKAIFGPEFSSALACMRSACARGPGLAATSDEIWGTGVMQGQDLVSQQGWQFNYLLKMSPKIPTEYPAKFPTKNPSDSTVKRVISTALHFLSKNVTKIHFGYFFTVNFVAFSMIFWLNLSAGISETFSEVNKGSWVFTKACKRWHLVCDFNYLVARIQQHPLLSQNQSHLAVALSE